MPHDIDRAVRMLARGQLELLRIPDITYVDRALIMGQALAFASIESERHLRGAAERTPLSVERLRELRAWVQDVMVRCHQDRIFRDILAFYDATLTLNSEGAIQEALQLLHPEIQRRLEDSFDEDLSSHDPKNWIQLGQRLGQIAEGTASGVLIYARAKGLVTSSEMEAMGVDLPALEKFRRQVLARQGIDLAKARGRDMRAYIEMHQEIRNLVGMIQGYWGESHPLLRGFNEDYFPGHLDKEQEDFLYDTQVAVENYLYTPRH